MPGAHEAAAVNAIGTLNENALHAELKRWLARPGDRSEVAVDGFLIDLVRDEELIEIQTRNFAAIRTKLVSLLDRHRVRLVFPVAESKWIVRIGEDGNVLGRRRSPKRGRVEAIFSELVSLPDLCDHSRFTLEVLLIHEEETRRFVGQRAWRKRGWGTSERRLLQVVENCVFETPAQLTNLIPATMAEPFGTADLATALDIPRRLAQQMTYCLRRMGTIRTAGKQGKAHLYVRC